MTNKISSSFPGIIAGMLLNFVVSLLFGMSTGPAAIQAIGIGCFVFVCIVALNWYVRSKTNGQR